MNTLLNVMKDKIFLQFTPLSYFSSYSIDQFYFDGNSFTKELFLNKFQTYLQLLLLV